MCGRGSGGGTATRDCKVPGFIDGSIPSSSWLSVSVLEQDTESITVPDEQVSAFSSAVCG